MLHGNVLAKSVYKDTELKVGDVLHLGSFISISDKTCIQYYYSVQEEKPFQIFEYEAGREASVKSIGDTFDCVVLFNEVVDGIRIIEFYPLVNNGVGGVGVWGLSADESVTAGSWMDFDGTGSKAKAIRYFKEGETEPFYTQTVESRYARVMKRAQSSSFEALDYSVTYWHVKNVDSYSGTVDLVAGRDVGLADMVKANEMYRGQIIAAGTLADYSAARYITFHFYQSEYMYDRGKEFYAFDYQDRKEGEERFIIIGQGYPYAAYRVMSANTSHVHLVALDSYFELPDEQGIYPAELHSGDVLYNGTVLRYLSSGPNTVNYYTSDRTPVLSESITYLNGDVTVANPEGMTAGSWVVFHADDDAIELAPLSFAAEGLLIPSERNQKEAYSGACVEVGGRNYYYYDRLSVAITDAKANSSLSRESIIGKNNVFNNNFDCDRVLLLKDVELIDAVTGASTGVDKGIVIDFNGHNAGGVRVGTIPAKETLVFTNSGEKASYITGTDAFLDNNTKQARTGTVVFNNLNIASKIYPAMHTIYLLNGRYVLNSATVMDNTNDISIIRDTEECPLYKFDENYPYRGRKQLEQSSGQAPVPGSETKTGESTEVTVKPAADSSTEKTSKRVHIFLPIVILLAAAATVIILVCKKKK